MKDTEIYQIWQRIDQLNANSTLKALSEDIGISYSTLRSQRTRNILPNVETILKIAEVLNSSVDYILTGSNISKKIYPDGIDEIADKLCKVSIEDLFVVKRLVDTLPIKPAVNKAQIS